LAAEAQIAQRLSVPVSTVKNVIIWGNHSSTQYPDVNHGTVQAAGGITVPIRSAVNDDTWLQVGPSARWQEWHGHVHQLRSQPRGDNSLRVAFSSLRWATLLGTRFA
jgi:hypothetical protein